MQIYFFKIECAVCTTKIVKEKTFFESFFYVALVETYRHRSHTRLMGTIRFLFWNQKRERKKKITGSYFRTGSYIYGYRRPLIERDILNKYFFYPALIFFSSRE